MPRLIAKLVSLVLAYLAGLLVYREVREIAGDWIPWVAGAAAFVVVFCVLYFPLVRHIADSIGDRIAGNLQRGRHFRTGSGIDSLPPPPKKPPCSICGDPRGPICPKCNEEMSDNNGPRITLEP